MWLQWYIIYQQVTSALYQLYLWWARPDRLSRPHFQTYQRHRKYFSEKRWSILVDLLWWSNYFIFHLNTTSLYKGKVLHWYFEASRRKTCPHTAVIWAGPKLSFQLKLFGGGKLLKQKTLLKIHYCKVWWWWWKFWEKVPDNIILSVTQTRPYYSSLLFSTLNNETLNTEDKHCQYRAEDTSVWTGGLKVQYKGGVDSR